MKCPKCKKDIEKVWVISECQQEGILKDNTVVEYHDLDVLSTTLRIHCQECEEDITEFIDEV